LHPSAAKAFATGAIYLKAVLPEDRKQSGVKDFRRLQHREMSDAVKDMNTKPFEPDLSAAKRPFLRIDSLDRRAVQRPASFDVPVQKTFQDRQRGPRIGLCHFTCYPVDEAKFIARRRDPRYHARYRAGEVGHEGLPAHVDRFAVEVAIESGVGERVNADNEPASLAESQTRL